MAEVVAVLGVPHTPLLWRTITAPLPQGLQQTAANFARCRSVLAAAQPDAVVLVASDHFGQLFTHNMPALMVGKAPVMRGTLPHEERSFGLPRSRVPGHPELARRIVGRHELPPGFDFAYSDEPWLDHGSMVPLLYLTPELDVPVVPILTNTIAPPIPRAGRFAALGGYLRETIAGWDGADRVAVIGSGHMAQDIGGPRHFLTDSIDPEFDAEAVAWMSAGDLDAAVAGCTFDRLLAAGNTTHQFLNLVTCLAAADSAPPVVAEATPSPFGMLPFFAWERTS